MNEKLILKQKLRGEDGFRTFSVRIRDDTVDKLDGLSLITNRSRNELVNILIDYALSNCVVQNNTTDSET
ncbi:MAG: CopG family transcriptional regulator [Ruminococcaceae bacterium]|nr:CopG family transcriptional regulator [Oscillospiraceae bacterium]